MSWFPVFDPSYEVILADTDAARRIHFRLRYRVYCLEEGLEEASKYPNGEETDGFDWNAVHFLVRFKPTGQWVAALRLVIPGPNGLPISTHARLGAKFEQGIADRPGRVAEVSRLCIIEEFRLARKGECRRVHQGTRGNDNERTRQRRQREILLGLFRAISVWCDQRNIEQLLFLISPALARVLTFLNLTFEIIGPPCRHRGLRYPCSAQLADVLPVLIPNDPKQDRRGGRFLVAFRCYSEIDMPVVGELPITNDLDTCHV